MDEKVSKRVKSPFFSADYTAGILNGLAPEYATVDGNGVKHYSYKHWGRVDEDLKFHPNRAFLYLSLEERNKLIFPKDWDMSELDELSGTRRRGRVSYQKDDVDRQYGATWLLDQVAECTGLKEDLRAVFGGNMEIVEDVLTMAYYPFLDNLSYNQLSQWQKGSQGSISTQAQQHGNHPTDSSHH